MARPSHRRFTPSAVYSTIVVSTIFLGINLFVFLPYSFLPSATDPYPHPPDLPDLSTSCRSYFQSNTTSTPPALLPFLQPLRLPTASFCPTAPLTLPSTPNTLLASNLKDSLPILPHFTHQLLRYTFATSPGKTYISIYASGSTDTTPQYLTHLSNLLTACAIPHTITPSGPLTRGPHEPRIHFLARVRNAALDPLIHKLYPATQIAFINDVFFCAEHIPRLASHNASLACGMDFEPILADLPPAAIPPLVTQHLNTHLHLPRPLAALIPRSTPLFKLWRRAYARTPQFLHTLPLLFYDTWVARDISGRRITRLPPYTPSLSSQYRLSRNLPTPVHCCWNGIVLLPAAPFFAGLRFRAAAPNECDASECSLLCDDLWRAGHRRFVMDPAVRVAYREGAAWRLHTNAVGGLPPATPTATPAEPINWDHPDCIPAGVVECCPILPGRNTVDFEKGCFDFNLSATNFTQVALAGGGGGV